MKRQDENSAYKKYRNRMIAIFIFLIIGIFMVTIGCVLLSTNYLLVEESNTSYNFIPTPTKPASLNFG